MFKKISLLVLLVLLIFSVSLTPVHAENGREGGILRAAMQTNPPTLDPHRTTQTSTQQIALHVFEPLVSYDGEFTPELVLLEDWDFSREDLEYTFYLREDVLFHNGEVMTSEDVKASLERIITDSPVSGRFEDVSNINIIDDHTLVIEVDNPVDLIANLSIQHTVLAIMPKEYAEKDEELGVDELIGTGPFELVEWEPDVVTRVRKFEDYKPHGPESSGYAGERIPYLDEIHFIPVTEIGARMAGLEAGEYHYAESVPIEEMNRIEENPELEGHFVEPLWKIAWELNQTEPPMDDVYFRRAVMAALDNDNIMSTVAFGNSDFYLTDPGYLFGPWSDWHTDIGAEYYNQNDLERARELLDKAEYEGEDIIILSNRDYDWMYRATLAASAQLEAAGISVSLEFMDWGSQIGKALELEDWHINQSGWSPIEDPIRHISSLQTGQDYAYGYSNPEMDELLDEILLQGTFEERQEIWEQIQKLYYEDVPTIQLGYLFGLEVTREEVQNYEPFIVVPRFWNVWLEE